MCMALRGWSPPNGHRILGEAISTGGLSCSARRDGERIAVRGYILRHPCGYRFCDTVVAAVSNEPARGLHEWFSDVRRAAG